MTQHRNYKRVWKLGLAVGLGMLPPFAASAQSTSSTSNSLNTPRPFDPGQNTTNPSAFATQTQNPFLGSVPTGKLVPGILPLSMKAAVDLALRANLGYVDAEQDHRQSRAERLRALSVLLPQVQVQSTEEYRNLVADTLGVPKLGLPHTISAFNYQTAHAVLQQQVLDLPSIYQVHSTSKEVAGSQASTEDARNIVTLAAVSSYLLAAASQIRLETVKAQLATAKTADSQLSSRVKSELSPAIDELRANVALHSAELRVKLAETNLEKDKLSLTRIIGLPIEQQFTLTDGLQYQVVADITLDSALAKATVNRRDLQAAKARMESAAEAVKARKSERLPTIDVRANAGETGTTFGRPYRDYEVEGRISIPVFTGRRIEADVLGAQALLARRIAELADTGARVQFDVRTALLDLSAAQTSVEVSLRTQALAKEGLRQATDRFNVGLSTIVDLIQAQQAVAEADDNRLASFYAHQLSKLILIRATGTAEQDYLTYMGAK